MAVVLVSASPDWWVMTGFERVTLGKMDAVTSFQQSWFLMHLTVYKLATAGEMVSTAGE